MNNPILEMLNQRQASNNPLQMLQEFQKFKNQMQGKDAKGMVMELLNSGRMSQQQFQQLKQQADYFSKFLK